MTKSPATTQCLPASSPRRLRTQAQSWHLRHVSSKRFPLAFSLYQNYFLTAVLALCLSPGLLLTLHTIIWITTLRAHKHCCPSEDPLRATIAQWRLCPAIFVRSTLRGPVWFAGYSKRLLGEAKTRKSSFAALAKEESQAKLLL